MKMINVITPRRLMKLLSFWPPYFFSGIKIIGVNDNFTKIDVCMKQRFWNTNYVGSHFGGSLYSMCDPFYMFILLHHLKGHTVWDKGAKFNFKKPGYGTVFATFEIELETIQLLKEEASKSYSFSPVFKTVIRDQANTVILELEKTLYIKKKAKT